MTELRKSKHWDDVLDYWEKNYEMGLYWKRYDRMEWLSGDAHNPNELSHSWSLNNVFLILISELTLDS